MADANTNEQPPTVNFAPPPSEIYADGGRIEVSPVTVTLTLATGRRVSGVVRMSPTYAKMFAILLRKYIKEAEEKWGEPIAVPDAVLKERGVTLDDW